MIRIFESEYTEQAEEFLRKTNTKMTITKVKTGINPNWNDNTIRDIYRVTFTHNRVTRWILFYNSVHSTERGIAPTPYDILACIQKYAVEDDFEDFCYEFGLEPYIENIYGNIHRNKSAYNIFLAVQKEYQKVLDLGYTDEEMELLQEIQ